MIFIFPPFFMYLMACWLGRWCAFGQKNRNRSEIDEWTPTGLSPVCKLFNLMFFFFPEAHLWWEQNCVCNIYAHAILHTCPGLLSYLLLCFLCADAAAAFPPFIFLVFADYYFLLLLQSGKYHVCVCVVKNRAEKSWEFWIIFPYIFLHFFYFILLFGSCLDDR